MCVPANADSCHRVVAISGPETGGLPDGQVVWPPASMTSAAERAFGCLETARSSVADIHCDRRRLDSSLKCYVHTGRHGWTSRVPSRYRRPYPRIARGGCCIPGFDRVLESPRGAPAGRERGLPRALASTDEKKAERSRARPGCNDPQAAVPSHRAATARGGVG